MIARMQWAKVAVLLASGLALLLALALTTHAQIDSVYRLHGRVLNGVTHRPIARALVASNDRRLATMTDTNGNFTLDVSVPPPREADATAQRGLATAGLSIALTANRPGFTAKNFFQQIEVNANTAAKDVTLELLPLGTLSGTVEAEGMGPVAKVLVMLLQHQVSEGTATWVQRNAQQTGERGEFHFGDLQPGEYTVMTREWEGDAAAYQRESRQYPPRFAGDAGTLAAATRLQLHYGGDEQLRLHLRIAAYYPVRIPVQALALNSGVTVRVLADDNSFGYSLGWTPRDRAVEGSLPSGNYTVLLTSAGSQVASVRVPLAVADAPVQHAPVTLAAAANILIRLHLDFAEKESDENGGGGLIVGFGLNGPPTQASPVDVYLVPAEVGGGFLNSRRQAPGDEPVIERVPPGTYTVHARTIRGYIAAVSAGGVDLLQRSLVVGDGGSADSIDVTVRNDSGTLTGEVDLSAEPAARFTAVLLVATDGSGRTVQGFAQSDGKFSVRNIPPGTYRAFATSQQQMQQVPYHDAAAMQPLERLGTLVTVTANQTADVKLRYELLLAAQGN